MCLGTSEPTCSTKKCHQKTCCSHCLPSKMFFDKNTLHNRVGFSMAHPDREQ